MRVLKAAVLSTLLIAGIGTLNAAAATSVPDVCYGTPVVDGVKDAIYDKMQPIETKNVVRGSAIEEPSTAKAWMAWDDDGLYVYAEVTETTPANEAAEEYKQDSVEIFTDEDNSKSTIKDGNDTQYRVTALGSRSMGNAATKDFKSAATKTDYGYTVEMMLPWLQILPTDGTVMGFDILINDALGLERQGMTAWSTEDNTNYVSTKNYGEIRLVFGADYVKKSTGTIRVSVNGYKLDCGETQPFIKEGRTLVPMRAIFEALKCEVCWNEKENAVYTIGNNKLVKIVIDSNIAEVNGEPYTLDVAATTVNDRTVVPLRFIAETLGSDVRYDDALGIVFIKDSVKEETNNEN